MKYIHKILGDLTGTKFQCLAISIGLFLFSDKFPAYYLVVIMLAYMGANLGDKMIARFTRDATTPPNQDNADNGPVHQ
jgi:hypothetical protein